MVSIDDLNDAYKRINPYIVKTPIHISEALNKKFDSNIFLKDETKQLTGSFKIRGALSALSKLKQNNINHKLIIRYYFHKNNRWDLYFKNDILLKLPESRVGEALKIYNILQNNENIKSGSIVDLRIINKAIISNE